MGTRRSGFSGFSSTWRHLLSGAAATSLLAGCAASAAPTEDVAVDANGGKGVTADSWLKGNACLVGPANVTASGRTYGPGGPYAYYPGEAYGPTDCPDEWVLEMDNATPALGDTVEVSAWQLDSGDNGGWCAGTVISLNLWGWLPSSAVPGSAYEWQLLDSVQNTGVWEGDAYDDCSFNTPHQGYGVETARTTVSAATYRVTASATRFGALVSMGLSFNEPYRIKIRQP